ncbi:MAG: helix-turn-helix domain-containing protein, partial [Kiritimatiellae bacterium]|nr:helix-turn-helix domain-containing protein [Kiritimatiellia bacterium]
LDERIELEHLAFAPAGANAAGPPAKSSSPHLTCAPEPLPNPLSSSEQSEAARISAALERTHWNRRKAAELLGMSYSTLREKIARHALR